MNAEGRGGLEVVFQSSSTQLAGSGVSAWAWLVGGSHLETLTTPLACFSCMGQCFLALLVTRTLFSAAELLSSVRPYQTYEIKVISLSLSLRRQ